MRLSYFFGFALFGSFAVGADDHGGCSGGNVSVNVPDTRADASAEGGGGEGPDGGPDIGGPVSRQWPTPPLPVPGPSEPMTCAWLDGDNCWKRVAAEIEACAPGATALAPFSEDRRSCTHADGSRTEYAGPIDAPPSNLQIVDNRIVGADGSPCMTGKILGLGKVLISSATESVIFESDSLLTYKLTCSDGKTYASSGAGVCPYFGAYYLGGKTPGSVVTCDPKSGTCTHELKGTPSGSAVVSRCGP